MSVLALLSLKVLYYDLEHHIRLERIIFGLQDRRIATYACDAKLIMTTTCKQCRKPCKRNRNSFCCHDCYIKFTFGNRVKEPCLQCGSEILGRKAVKFCTQICSAIYRKQQTYNLIQADKLESVSDYVIKQFLLDTLGHSCNICLNQEWNDLPIPLEIDHIDGHSDNRVLSNYRLLCPNCHAQTPTYKSKNKGNGRHSRRQRYAEGKSY